MPSEVEIGVWVGSVQKWVTGVTRRTSCHDVIKALLRAQSLPARDSDVNEYVLMERWRKVERPLDHEQRILKVWKTWGEAIQEVRFTLRRIKAEDADASDSDTGSRVERIRKRHKWKQQQQQQQQQRQLQGVKIPSDQRHSSSSAAAGATGAAHKKTQHVEDTKMNETMERLMRLVVAQGETIQTQLRRMQERDQQIENFEQQLHLFRVQNMGSDYLLQSYLKDPAGDATQNPLHSEASAFVKEEEKSNDSGVVTEELCDADLRPVHFEKPHKKSQQSASYEELEDIRNRTFLLDKLDKVLERLLEHEEALLKLENSLTESAACELAMLEEEIATAAALHASTVANVRKNEQSLRELDIVLYQRRTTLDSLLEEDAKYEREALALQAHLDYIIHLPPTAFKLPEETESLLTRFPLESSLKSSHVFSALNNPAVPSHLNSLLPSDILTTNAVPMIITPESKIISPKSNVLKDSLTVIPVVTSNNKTPPVSSSPREVPPPLPSTSPPPLEVDEEDDKDSAKAGSLCVSSRSSTSSDSSRTASKPATSEGSKDVDTTDSNSDTGLSSLHSSSDEGAYVFDTLV